MRELFRYTWWTAKKSVLKYSLNLCTFGNGSSTQHCGTCNVKNKITSLYHWYHWRGDVVYFHKKHKLCWRTINSSRIDVIHYGLESTDLLLICRFILGQLYTCLDIDENEEHWQTNSSGIWRIIVKAKPKQSKMKEGHIVENLSRINVELKYSEVGDVYLNELG